MSDPWFTEEGGSGELFIKREEKGWFVEDTAGVGETRCIIPEKAELNQSGESQKVHVEVSNFIYGMGDDHNYLYADSISKTSDGHVTEDDESRERVDDDGRTRSDTHTSNEEWDLVDFNGTGEFVDLEAQIDALFFVKKGTKGVPDIKGELRDESMLNPVVFVVSDGVQHPYFEEGDWFRFENVKDHYYKKKGEVQVVIHESTEITRLQQTP